MNQVWGKKERERKKKKWKKKVKENNEKFARKIRILITIQYACSKLETIYLVAFSIVFAGQGKRACYYL